MFPLKVFESALNCDQRDSISEFLNCQSDHCHIGNFFSLKEAVNFLPLLNKAAGSFEFFADDAFEVWCNVDTRPSGWHIDQHEAASKKGQSFRPICTFVYYLDVSNDLVGGRLCVFDELTQLKHYVKPKRNRLILFGPGMLHRVEHFKGRRRSLIINPWRATTLKEAEQL